MKCFAALGILFCLLMIGFQFLTAASAPRKLSSYDDEVKTLLAKMTLEEKIGQMTQPEQDRVLSHPGDMQKYFIGSVLSGGNSDPKEGNDLKSWTDLYDHVQEEALKTRLAIPVLYGIDAVHGHSNVLGAVMFPHNIALGCTRDPALVEKIHRITAEEVLATGIQWTFAPCVTVPQDIRWGRTYEGFAEDPALVSLLGKASVLGLQGPELGGRLSILACAKHYVADGGTSAAISQPGPGAPGGPGLKVDQGNSIMDEAQLRRIHLPGYVAAVKAGVGSIMPSYSMWNGVRCSASKQLLTDILKQELKFEGFLISDYEAIRQINPQDYKGAIATSINAGMDMAMVPQTYAEYFQLLKELVDEGKVPMSRIDDAVMRILRVKFSMGLMDKSRSQMADRNLHKTFGSAEHKAVAREAVRKSVVLLKNEKKTLPISKTIAHIVVAGKSADNIGNQCGGWTIQWQGQTGRNDALKGTTVLAAIKAAVSKSAKVTYSADGTQIEGASLGIAVIGETPYAEGVGDRPDLSLAKEDVEVVANLKKAGIPVLVILISGRPMIISDVLPQSDAFMAAFLPGTEGQGIADVLFGDFKPTARLSFSWPKSMDQLPLNKNIDKSKYDPLFPFGFGLSY